jgi:prolipoprotein diacylglyceryltransferase
MFRHKRRHGQMILAFAVLYGVSRFLMEFLRADEAPAYLLGLPTLLRALGHEAAGARLGGLTISQNVAVVIVAAAAGALVLLGRSTRHEWQATYAPPAPTVRGPDRPDGRKRPRPRKGKHG